MCTYYRPIRTGNIVEFIFERDLSKNQYILTNHPNITFYFSLFDKFATFTINTGHFSNKGYGTALMDIMFDIIRNNHLEIEIISGWLSDVDFYNENWKISIPFYLGLQENSFLIKEKLKMRYVYPKYKDYEDFYKAYEHFNNYNDFTEIISNGHIIYPLL